MCISTYVASELDNRRTADSTGTFFSGNVQSSEKDDDRNSYCTSYAMPIASQTLFLYSMMMIMMMTPCGPFPMFCYTECFEEAL